MQITVFGASGKVGRRVVRLALQDGCTVVAFVHRHSRLPEHPKLRVVQGDVRNPGDVEKALKGSRAVISCLGSWGRGPKDVLTAGMSVIIPEMESLKIKRIVSLTGADALLPDQNPEGVHALTHGLMQALAGKILFDGERHLRMLAESSLAWTVLRAPRMNNFGAQTRRLTLYPLSPLASIRRQQVAESLLEQLKRTKTIGKAPYISRR